MLQPLLKDEQLQAQFERDGFVKFRLLDESQVKQLLDFYNRSKTEHEAAINQRALHSTTEIFDAKLITVVDAFIRQVTAETIEKHFINSKFIAGCFLGKQIGDDTELHPHQDLTFVDEPNYCVFNVWMPLQRTYKGTGHLKILKGSHKIRKTLRVAPYYEWVFNNVKDKIPPYLTDVYTEEGECVILNLACIHGSDVNLGPLPRIAAIQTMCSAAADINYYYWPKGAPNDKIEKYAMEPSDYCYIQSDGKPGRGKFVEYVSYPFDPIDEKMFDNWLNKNFKSSLWNKMRSVFKVPA